MHHIRRDFSFYWFLFYPLGGGVIIKKGFSISGLNAAVTLWCAAATGVLAGAGFLLISFLGSIFVCFLFVPHNIEENLI